jgi:hypothetical protein
MIQGKKLKNRRARNIGIRMGISQENHCKMLFLKRCCHWGIPLSLTAMGAMRITR